MIDITFTLRPAENGWIIDVYTAKDGYYKGSVVAEDIQSALEAIRSVVDSGGIDIDFDQN